MKLHMFLSAVVFGLLSAISLPILNNLYWSKLKPIADLVVKNGTIFTSDESLPFADSMAIRNGRILRVGDYSSIQDLVADGTKELNLGGKTVVPGFIDSHVHLILGGLQMIRLRLQGVNHKDDFIRRVEAAVQSAKKGSWILGGGWNNDLWGGELPTASWIDDISPSNPVWLIRMDGHMGLANSIALALAEIDSSCENPKGGTIMKTSSGEPTGLLIDAAMKVMFPIIPEDSIDEKREAIFRASKHALAKGVTTVVDMGRYLPGTSSELPWEDLSEVYLWADSMKKMAIRICLYFPIYTWGKLYALINQRGRVLSDWLYLGGVKAFLDGSLGSNSAFFHEAYSNEPGNYGLQVMDLETLFNLTTTSDQHELQVAIHAIGDKANDIILDLYEAVAAANGERDRRFRIEHAQHLATGSAGRFGQLGVIASVQPDHLLDDAESAEVKLGEERARKGSFLFHSLLAGNALLALGSDWPVTEINPLRSIRTAVKRRPPGWQQAWNPSECLSLKEALIAHTISAAKACFLDHELGSLSPGKLADFVVLSKSWGDFAGEVTALVQETYVSGRRAYP